VAASLPSLVPFPARLLPCLIGCLALASVLGCHKTPYSCVKVSGKVTYEDGRLIPAEKIRILFVSQTPPIDAKTSPRNGNAEADVATGRFDSAMTFVKGDGIIVGQHKVVIQCIRDGLLTHDLVLEEYSDPAKTPLVVQSGDSPFDFKLRKPAQH